MQILVAQAHIHNTAQTIVREQRISNKDAFTQAIMRWVRDACLVRGCHVPNPGLVRTSAAGRHIAIAW